MQAIVNEQYAASRARIGSLANLAGIVTLVGGFAIAQIWQDYILVAYALLIGGFIAFNIGKRNAMRWGRWARLPRADVALTKALKGLDNKYQLFSYLEGVPTDHLLLTPYGLTVLEVRPFFGRLTVNGDRWKRPASFIGFLQFFAEGSLGSPSREARENSERVSELLVHQLGEIGKEVPVNAAVVLTHPRVELVLDDPGVPVVKIGDLRSLLRGMAADAPKLPPLRHRQIAQALRDMAPAATGRSRRT